jgi:hypothetical protein
VRFRQHVIETARVRCLQDWVRGDLVLRGRPGLVEAVAVFLKGHDWLWYWARHAPDAEERERWREQAEASDQALAGMFAKVQWLIARRQH